MITTSRWSSVASLTAVYRYGCSGRARSPTHARKKKKEPWANGEELCLDLSGTMTRHRLKKKVKLPENFTPAVRSRIRSKLILASCAWYVCRARGGCRQCPNNFSSVRSLTRLARLFSNVLGIYQQFHSSVLKGQPKIRRRFHLFRVLVSTDLFSNEGEYQHFQPLTA